LFDIASDQIRALRSRVFIDAVARGTVCGVMLRMGNSTCNLDLTSGRTRPSSDYDGFSSEDEAALPPCQTAARRVR
jgi:NTE family protein